MKKFINWLIGIFCPECIIVNEYEYDSLVTENKYLTQSRDDWSKAAQENLNGWNKSMELINSYSDHSTKLCELTNALKENCDKWEALSTKQFELLNRYSDDWTSLSKTVDSLIGELIILGKTNHEIAQMFDKDYNYVKFMNELHLENE